MKHLHIYLSAASILLILSLFLLTPLNPTKSKQKPSFNTLSEFADYVRANNAKNAYKVLKEKFPNNEATAHDFAHVTGSVAYEQNGLSNLAICDSAFNYGCYHGFIEAFLADKGIESINQIEQKCLGLGNIHSPSCLHGIGHGVLSQANYELKRALNDCQNLTLESRIYCHDGVFMERISNTLRGPLSRSLLTDQTLNEPCNSLELIYQETCYRNQVSAWFSYFAGNSPKILSRCQKIPKNYQKTCFESTGFKNVMIVGENKEGLIALCRLPNGQAVDDCLIGELKELLFEGKSPQVAQGLCQEVAPNNRTTCQEEYRTHFNQFKIRFNN